MGEREWPPANAYYTTLIFVLYMSLVLYIHKLNLSELIQLIEYKRNSLHLGCRRFCVCSVFSWLD